MLWMREFESVSRLVQAQECPVEGGRKRDPEPVRDHPQGCTSGDSAERESGCADEEPENQNFDKCLGYGVLAKEDDGPKEV